MTKKYAFLFLWLVLFPGISCSFNHSEKIAVLDFDGYDIKQEEATVFSDYLRAGLESSGHFRVVAKEDTYRAIKELNIQRADFKKTETAFLSFS